MMIMSRTTPAVEWVPESLAPSTDILLRLRRLEAHVEALELAVRNLAETFDQAGDCAPASLIREMLDDFHL
jgi:hypothetical protein